ncbi:MAG: N-acetyltransferase [Bacilli bacterium]|nr:N-acetyltransferase [Bacilli bacterium]
MENNIKIENNKILYEEDGIIFGYIEFIYLDDNTVDIIHTFVDPNHRGKGIAKKLVEYAFSYFEEKDINVIYSCSYVQKYKEK